MFLIRFDMRAPNSGPATINELYSSALDMAQWAEQHNCLSLLISEHHCAEDNYLPSPLLLASAIAARTSTLSINVGAVLLNMYDPIKLAEDMSVLHIIGNGRVSHTIGLGYREEEYAMFGVAMEDRAQVMEDKLSTLLRALSGEAFTWQGRSVQVTPTPQTPITISYGGHSKAAARRAGRFGLHFFANGGEQSLLQDYQEAARAAGHEPGMASIPTGNSPQSLFVAEDVDAGWQQYGPYLLHDAQMYRKWEGEQRSAVSSFANTVEELRAEAGRAEAGPYAVVTPEEAVAMIKAGNPLMLHPLCGGCPPDIAWESLRLIEEQVLPRLA